MDCEQKGEVSLLDQSIDLTAVMSFRMLLCGSVTTGV